MTSTVEKLRYAMHFMQVAYELDPVCHLKKMTVYDAENGSVDVIKTQESLSKLIEVHGMKHYSPARMALLNLLNFLYFSGMTDSVYFTFPMSGKDFFETLCICRWWWENIYHLKESIVIAAFLEGRNRESLGAKEISYDDIPQSLSGVRSFIQEFERNTKLIQYLREEHHRACSECDEIVRLYCGNTELSEKKHDDEAC